MKKAVATAMFAAALLAGPASAEWIQPAKVRFESGSQFTPWTTAQITFATGAEMNKASGSFAYNALGGRYAVIPLGQGETNIVHLSGFAFCTETSIRHACRAARRTASMRKDGIGKSAPRRPVPDKVFGDSAVIAELCR